MKPLTAILGSTRQHEILKDMFMLGFLDLFLWCQRNLRYPNIKAIKRIKGVGTESGGVYDLFFIFAYSIFSTIFMYLFVLLFLIAFICFCFLF